MVHLVERLGVVQVDGVEVGPLLHCIQHTLVVLEKLAEAASASTKTMLVRVDQVVRFKEFCHLFLNYLLRQLRQNVR